MTLLVGHDRDGFNVVFEARALFLRRVSLADVVSHAHRLVREIARAELVEVRTRRADLFADVCGLAFGPEDAEHFVSRARRSVRFHAPEKVYARRRASALCCTGFTVAPGNPLMVRMYDKLEELLVVQGRDSEKTRTEVEQYRRAGWDEVSSVWRVEAQLRTEPLRELGAGSPDELLERLAAIWAYVVGTSNTEERAWLRLVVPDGATRPERCPTDARWATYQQAFGGLEVVPAVRVAGRRNNMTEEQAVGTVRSLLASAGMLEPLAEGALPAEVILRDFEAAARLVATNRRIVETYNERRAADVARNSHHDDAQPMVDAS
jgi:hypothetical protein